MSENYRLIAETSLYLLFHRVDAAQTTWQRFVLELKRSPVRKRRYQIGWNGERLADGPEIEAARDASRQSVEWVQMQLRQLYPKAVSTVELLCAERQIPFLVHFTQTKNLQSILKHGIHPRGRPRKDIEIAPNDQLRLDGHTEATSLSISFPNCRMFYKYRITASHSDWVVLLLDKSILWTRNCAYCAHNAADSRIAGRPLEELRRYDALLEMFAEQSQTESRIEQRLLPCDPTDVQAEVLVFNIIPSKLIRAMIFETSTKMDSFASAQSVDVQPPMRVSKSFFSDRRYVRSLQS